MSVHRPDRTKLGEGSGVFFFLSLTARGRPFSPSWDVSACLKEKVLPHFLTPVRVKSGRGQVMWRRLWDSGHGDSSIRALWSLSKLGPWPTLHCTLDKHLHCLFLESESESCVTAAAGAWLDMAQPSATHSRAEQQVTRHFQPGLQDTVKTILQGKEFNKSKFL